ncbi:MAG: MFS transporter [Pseudomonadota bacterium]|nr:MFS transporter [Pseudomonadota bacterium]
MTDLREIHFLKSWLKELGVYKQPKILAMLFLGFSSGLPFALVAGTLAAWLTVSGVTMTEIGMFAWIGILYAFKFLWAPFVDHISIPFLSRVFGRRRGWMLLGQVGVAFALIGMALADPIDKISALAWFAAAAAFFSATQDIAVDAWRIEIVETKMQAAMAASYQLGYRVALLIASAGALTIADSWSWKVVYPIMALLMLVGIITVVLISEPSAPKKSNLQGFSLITEPISWLSSAVFDPISDFFQRNGKQALIIILFIGIYRISDTVLGVMANPFYLITGFTEAQIALYAKGVGFFAVIIGAALGGAAVIRNGLGPSLIFGAIILALTNLSFALLAFLGANVPLLAITICADNLAQGFTGTIFIAYLSSLTSISYTATQYALFTSLMVLPGKILSGFSGVIVDSIGWISFFTYAAFMGIPAIFLSFFISRRLQ